MSNVSNLPGGGLLGYATDAECIAACLAHIGKLEATLRNIQKRALSHSWHMGQDIHDMAGEALDNPLTTSSREV